MTYTTIFYPQLQGLLADGAQLVEVLPAVEYDELHLPGARSIPLKTLDARTTKDLDPDRPVVVYCWDALCDMSPRAAYRLASLGFSAVHDYMPSKVDWMARGLAREGEKAGAPRALDYARTDVVTCAVDDVVGSLRHQVEASPFGFALVLGEDGVLVGRLRGTAINGDPQTRADDVMEPGPSTTRPDAAPAEVLSKLEASDLSTALLSDPDGRLMGVVRRGDLRQAVT